MIWGYVCVGHLDRPDERPIVGRVAKVLGDESHMSAGAAHRYPALSCNIPHSNSQEQDIRDMIRSASCPAPSLDDTRCTCMATYVYSQATLYTYMATYVYHTSCPVYVHGPHTYTMQAALPTGHRFAKFTL